MTEYPCPKCGKSLAWDGDQEFWKCGDEACGYSAPPAGPSPPVAVDAGTTTTKAAGRVCGNCRGTSFTRTVEQSGQGTGCLVSILGLILAPAIIGLPILVYGVHLATKGNWFDVCNSCGARLPAGTKTSIVVWMLTVLAVLLAAYWIFGAGQQIWERF